MAVRPHISFSEQQLWKICQWRWLRDYREERRSEVYSIYLTFGDAVHGALETLKNPEKKDDRPTVSQICDTFEEKFRTKYERVRDLEAEKLKKTGRDPFTDEDVDNFVLAGRRIIENLHRCGEIDDAQVLFVEYPLMERIDRTDGVELKFKGYIDLVIKTKDRRGRSIVYICDYKTCSWGWNAEKRRDEDMMSQLRLYKHFFSKKFKLDPKDVRTAFVLCKRISPTDEGVIEWLSVSSGPKTTMRAVRKLNEAITGMQSNDYKKNRKACVNKFGDICPHYQSPLCLED